MKCVEKMEGRNCPVSLRQVAQKDIEFLASSWNRLEVLEAITLEPRTRIDLRGLTEVSRVTLSRILADLEDAEWITRKNDHYEATPNGMFVTSEVTSTLVNLGTASQLGSIMEWLPIDRFDFDLVHLHDATIITPTFDNFTAQSKRLTDLVHESDRIRGIGTGIDHEFMGALWDACVNGDLELELILKDELFDSILKNNDLRQQFVDMIDAETVQIYRYDGDEPLTMVGIHDGVRSGDDVVMLCGQHQEGAPPGTIESTDETVRTWAESFFDTIRKSSHPIEKPTFAR